MASNRHIFSVRWIGIPSAIISFQNEFNAIIREARTVVKNTANRTARKSATALRRGRYKAYQSGRLASAHSVAEIMNTNTIKTYRVANTSDYALFIHNGTKRMAGRPWLRGTLNGEIPKFTKDIRAVVARKKTVEVGSAPSLSFTAGR